MSNSMTVAPYGKWDSPITAEHLSAGSIHLEGIQTNKPLTGQIFALESRPAEGGRFVIVQLDGTTSRDVLPAEYNAMGTIHEYGGGSFAIHPDGRLLFTNHPDNGLFLLDPASRKLETIIAPDVSSRYGDFHFHPTAKYILAVQESHVKDCDGSEIVKNVIIAVHVDTAKVSVIAEGADFYQHPQFSPDGKRVCWTEWNHPDMPWSGTSLYVARWEDEKLLERTLVSGKAGLESICQPRWGMDGTLFFVSDKTDYWQLYSFDGVTPKLICLKGLEVAEFGSREPCLGNCTYVLLDKKTMVASVNQSATSNLVLIDLETNTWKDLSLPIVDIQKNAIARLSSTAFAVIGSTCTHPQALYRVDLGDIISMKSLKSTIKLEIPDTVISQARHITFPRVYDKESNRNTSNAHAWFFEPKNAAFKGPEGSKAPLLVWMHGGPTYHVPPGLTMTTQYWTSRGYAYVSVNHVGSTGYGRAYRELLNGKWGTAEIADAASCVEYLASEGLIDSTKVGIVGESAGGYSVMQALYTYPDVWAAGISIYGVSSLSEFAATTHKFESHYIDSLVLGNGEKTKEEIEVIYRSRSAVNHAEKIKAPLLLLQGDVDTIVPPWQATRMVEIMRALGKTIKIKIFEGEGHGFHMDKTIRTSTEMQAQFWIEWLL